MTENARSQLLKELGIIRWVKRTPGDKPSLLMIVSDQPLNDREHILLKAMLRAIDLSEDKVILKTVAELNPDLFKQGRFVLLGKTVEHSLSTFLNDHAFIFTLTHHPRELIADPSLKRQAYQELCTLRDSGDMSRLARLIGS